MTDESPSTDNLTPRDQVELESRLARSLLAAEPEARAGMYGHVYDEIFGAHFERRPDVLDFGAQEAFMLPFLLAQTRGGQRVVEVGCGAGTLAVELARRGRIVTGYDVSSVVLSKAKEQGIAVPNVDFRLVEGFELPLADASVDFCYSVEVLEHLHEDDVTKHLHAVARVLKPGGAYWIHTPHPLDSPTACERFGVDGEAVTDIHLRVWTYRDLYFQLHRSGFDRVRHVWWFPARRLGRVPVVPIHPVRYLESLAARLPRNERLIAIAGVDTCSVLAHRAIRP
jgi:ubiquinone/menaquinone biosynthesis C-methylase UbiE